MQGTLPPALPPNVLYYNVSENYLNGTLPASWADANSSISLQYLDLNNNTLQARAGPVHAACSAVLLRTNCCRVSHMRRFRALCRQV